MSETICPLCKAENNCMAHSDKPCWCNQIKVTPALIERIPSELKEESCICHTCIEKFNHLDQQPNE